LPRLYDLPESARRKTFLVISLTANLVILGFFKYFDFFVTSMVDMLSGVGLGGMSWTTLGIILPAGISFYTFQAMSYTIDIYRGHAEPTEDFADFALFVAFFPHLVAGPIMRAETLLPQVTSPRQPDREEFREGVLLIAIGFFKKIVIADNMAPIANAVFLQFQGGQTASVSGAEVLVALYAFAFQIYGDFSGYSAIARGVSKLLGFELVINFRLPYLAVSPSDFWRRWHISLSTWLRDYVYFPIGGSRRGIAVTCRNLLFTMFLSGLWHGASWTTVVWGLYWGILMSFFALLRIPEPDASPVPLARLRWLARVIVMFHLTCLGWLLFRADSMSTAYLMFVTLLSSFQVTTAALAGATLVLWYCALLSLIEWLTDGEEKLGRVFAAPAALQSAVYLYLIMMMAVFPAEKAYEFIYFQF